MTFWLKTFLISDKRAESISVLKNIRFYLKK